ncbi:MAG: N-acetylglucosamine-6-phosphate deacetylase [Ruminococcaceae bacterium]|nr:N-acetylglucosamine-6-phosphate deacetylase [Oscillospiraceae bacterium]
MKYRLCNGSVVTDASVIEKDVLIKDGIIEAVTDRDIITDGYARIDCRELFISPGFVDIHQHGGGGSDYMDDDPDAYLNATNAHLTHGATSLMPTLLSADTENTLRAVRAYKKAKSDPRIKADLIGLHIEGPYISPHQAGAQKPEHIRAFDEREYKAIVKEGDGHIKRWSVAPEIDGVEKFAAFAKENQITLSIAHSNADLDTVLRAYEMGFHHITHFYSCVSTIVRRGGFRVPGVLEAGYYIDGMNVEIIADGCHLPHSLLRYVVKFKDRDRVALITDAMRGAGQTEGKSFLGSMDDPLPVIIEDGVAKLEDRSAFAGSVATADRLVRNMLMCGLSIPEAIQMITVNPISMMGLDLKKGRIAPGYDADICVFDSDINVKKVFCGGEPVL